MLLNLVESEDIPISFTFFESAYYQWGKMVCVVCTEMHIEVIDEDVLNTGLDCTVMFSCTAVRIIFFGNHLFCAPKHLELLPNSRSRSDFHICAGDSKTGQTHVR